jgi:hypothetical protein
VAEYVRQLGERGEVSEHQELKEYKQGDTIHLTVELRDEHGVSSGFARAFLEDGTNDSDPDQYLDLRGYSDGRPVQAEVVLEGRVEQHRPGVYECTVIVPENAYGAMRRYELNPPLRFRIVEHPDDIREGPEVLSVSNFW